MRSEFGDVIEGGGRIGGTRSPKGREGTKSAPENTVTILELVEDMNLEGFSGKINPEMKEKVLVPLATLLDKYGVSESLNQSETAQSTMGLVTLLNDVAPVIKGLAEYISGQRNSLKAEDREFLERIQDAQGEGEFSDLFITESEPESETLPPPLVGPRGENLSTINISDAKVDWYEVMGVPNPNYDMKGLAPKMSEAYFAKDVGSKLPSFSIGEDKPTLVGLESVEEIAANSGMAYEDVQQADSKYREVKSDDDLSEDTPTKNKTQPIATAETENLLDGMDMDLFEITLDSEE